MSDSLAPVLEVDEIAEHFGRNKTKQRHLGKPDLPLLPGWEILATDVLLKTMQCSDILNRL